MTGVTKRGCSRGLAHVRWALWMVLVCLGVSDRAQGETALSDARLGLSMAGTLRMTLRDLGSQPAWVEFEHTFRVMNLDSMPIDFFVGFSVPSAGLSGRLLEVQGRSVAYEVIASGLGVQPLVELPEARMEQVLSGSLQAGQTELLMGFTIRVSGSGWPAPGVYEDSLTLQLFSGTVLESWAVTSQTVQLELEVPERLELSFAPPSAVGSVGVGSLDFGEITGPSTRSIDCWVLSNTGYRVGLSSESGGVLAGPLGSEIPYTILWDGMPLRIRGHDEVVLPLGFPATGLEGRGHVLSATIQPEPGQTAGDYQDTIRISVWGE